MNVFDCHVNRAPLAGRVARIAYHPGRFLNASLDKASEANERNGLVLALADGRSLAVVQIAGLVARRIVCFVREGARLETGERFGLIRFGSRLDVYLPDGVAPLVCPGQAAVAGETVIADLAATEPPRTGRGALMPALRPPPESLPLRAARAEPRHHPRALRRPDRAPLHLRRASSSSPPSLIIFAALLDGVDGLLARRLNAASRFGAELELARRTSSTSASRPALLVYWLALAEAPDAAWTARAGLRRLRLPPARPLQLQPRRAGRRPSRTSSASPPPPARSSACCPPTSPSPASTTPVRHPWLVAPGSASSAC